MEGKAKLPQSMQDGLCSPRKTIYEPEKKSLEPMHYEAILSPCPSLYFTIRNLFGFYIQLARTLF